jgi:hypothetical protein
MAEVGSVYPPNYDASITGTVVAGDGSLVLGSPGVQFGTPSLRALVATGGVSSAQSFGAVTPRLAFKVGSVASAAQFGTPILTHPQTIAILGCPSAQQFGSTLRFNQTIHVNGVQYTVIPYLAGQYLTGQINVGYLPGHEPQFGIPTIYTIVRVAVAGVASAQQFGLAQAAQIVHPPGLGSAQQFGTQLGFKFRVLGVSSAAAFGVPVVFRVYLYRELCSDLDLVVSGCVGGGPAAMLAEFLCDEGVLAETGELLLVPVPTYDLDLEPAGCS